MSSVHRATILTCVAQLLLAGGSVAADKPWAYQSPARSPLPAVKNAAWVRNAVDAFILARLEAKGLSPSPAADPAVLIRRLSFDLTGLPPTPEEVAAFVNDPSPDTYEKLVDRLLASPRYGEHWAMYWLDLVRFAESDGFKADDPRPQAWRYRDYVIRALNTDKPYDRFLKEQLAGDELYPGNLEALVATGFNRHYAEEYNAVNLEQRRQEILNDMTDTTTQVFLGLTVGCARCHDHKYDPIKQEDYYRIQAFFAGYYPVDVPFAEPAEVAKHRQQEHEWQERTAELRQRMNALEDPLFKQLSNRRRLRFPKEYQDLLDIPESQRTPFQQQLALMVEKQVQIGRDEVVKAMKPEVREQWQGLAKQMDEFTRLKPTPLPGAMAITDVRATAPPTFLLRRGEWRLRDHEVAPGYLSAIDDRHATIASSSSTSSGRRTALAEWLTRPDHPLTGRVMMNRLWQQHFGRGIVGTPSDFGVQGDAPTHPELLDWLARDFVDSGWSLKAMHRLLVTSATYRQVSQPRNDESKSGIDPDNQMLWRMNRRRLEGEALRDAMLSVSGQLNPKAGGPSVYPELPTELGKAGGKWPVSADVGERNRASIYVFVKRNLRYPLFDTFDAPDRNVTCARRHISTTAPQALMLLNSKITLDFARAFATRALAESRDPAAVIDRTYGLALGRRPDAEERRRMADFLQRQTELLRPRLSDKNPPLRPTAAPADCDPAYGAAVVDLCHSILNLNEFMYVD